MEAIVARAWVPTPAEDIYALLADLREHWRLAGRWVTARELAADGGVVQLRGPLGLRRTARTTVVRTEPPLLLAGEARLGPTRAAVSWILDSDGAGTWVTLRADVLATGRLDRVLLALGGRRWLRARFAVTLRRLAQHAAHASPRRARVAVG
jgi:hypothetical protein